MIPIKLIDGGLAAASKTWSFRLATITAVIAGLEPLLPTLSAVLPSNWMLYASTAIAIARVLRQQQPDGQHRDA